MLGAKFQWRGEPGDPIMATQTATHAQVAARLLRGAADFFRSISGENPSIKRELEINAETCEKAADRIERDPMGEAPQLDDGSPG